MSIQEMDAAFARLIDLEAIAVIEEQAEEQAEEQDHSDFDGFMDDLATIAKKAGKEVLEKGLIAAYVAFDSRTPAWAQTLLVAALAYLVCPVDAIPDIIPVAGFTDDLAALVAVLGAIAANIRVRHVRAARATMNGWGIDMASVPEDWNDDEQPPHL